MGSTNRQLLLHMLDYADQIEEANKMFDASVETLSSNSVYRNAVAMCVLQIGELAGKLTEDFRDATNSEIPWRSVRGLRNVVAHTYGKVDSNSLWETITGDIPELKAFCIRQIQKLDQEEAAVEEVEEPTITDQNM